MYSIYFYKKVQMEFLKTKAVFKFLPLLVAGILFTTSSTEAQDINKEPTKMEQVMAAHDEVMDEMPKLVKLINKLQTKADASYEKTKYKKAIADLKSANKSMMTWMTGFGERFEADEMMKGKALSEQKEKWLLEEELKVAALKEEIELSIAQAEALVGE